MIFDIMFSSVVEEMCYSTKVRICIAGEQLVLWLSVPKDDNPNPLFKVGDAFGFFISYSILEWENGDENSSPPN